MNKNEYYDEYCNLFCNLLSLCETMRHSHLSVGGEGGRQDLEISTAGKASYSPGSGNVHWIGADRDQIKISNDKQLRTFQSLEIKVSEVIFNRMSFFDITRSGISYSF